MSNIIMISAILGLGVVACLVAFIVVLALLVHYA
jgi:hypothetical protein